MPDLGKVPATVITGFLGAGKTSLIRHVIERANGKRLANSRARCLPAYANACRTQPFQREGSSMARVSQ